MDEIRIKYSAVVDYILQENSCQMQVQMTAVHLKLNRITNYLA